MSRQKIVIPELFTEVVSSYIHTHPSQSDVFSITGDDRLLLCRFDSDKDDATVFEQKTFSNSIGCISFSVGGSRINCGVHSGFYSMDSEHLEKAVDKRVFDHPIVSIAPFDLSNHSYNLILGDQEGNLYLIDSREASTIKDRLFKSRTEGVAVTSMAVSDKIAYITCENGIIEAFDLKKRGFVQDFEFKDKMFMHIFIDDKTPVASTDEGEVLWLDMENQRVKFKAKSSDLIIERVTPISDDFALVKSMAGENLALLSLTDHKFIGTVSNEPALDVDSTIDQEHVIVGVDRGGLVNVEIWDTKEFLKNYNMKVHHEATSSKSDGFFAGLDGDNDL